MHVAIIGNGISGITAARHIRKLSDHRITVISSESDHFYSRTALMYIYMGHMRFEDTKPYEDWFWEKNRIDLLNAHVEKVDPASNSLQFSDGESLTYDKLIIACGSKSNKFGWPGQDLDGVHGLYSLQDLEAMENCSIDLERAVIVGGGLIGIEMAEMFHSRNIPVTFLVREDSFWDIVLPNEESAIVNRQILDNHIDLRLKTELKEIIDDGNGTACGVMTNHGEKIDCGFVGLTAGVSPNIKFLDGSGIETQKGVLVNEFLETNIPNIYAIGDCAQLRNPREGRRPIEAVWYTGRMAGETVAHVICGNRQSYDPGIWFNSAKFFDVEYQVYGTVLANPPEDHQSLYWEHPEGKMSVRLVYDKSKKHLLGINLMGIRFRHEVCEKWLVEEAHIEDVLKDLCLADFNPEFFKTYEPDIVKQYNNLTGSNIKMRSKRSLNSVLSFLKA